MEATGLLEAIENRMPENDMITCSAIVERFQPETGTMHMPFGEVGIEADAPKHIQGLKVRGKAVGVGFKDMDWEEMYPWAKKVLGWDRAKAELECCRAKKDVDEKDFGGINKKNKIRFFKLANLKKEFEGTLNPSEDRVVDEEAVRHTAGAYVLYHLGALIFPDSTGNLVSTNYLQLLGDLTTLDEYAWGTASLGHLINELGKASRYETKNLGGNWNLFQVNLYPCNCAIHICSCLYILC